MNDSIQITLPNTAQLPPNAVLLIIDVQKGMDDPSLGSRNNPQAEDNIVRLLHHWRQHGRPVFHVQHLSTSPHSPLRPDRPGHELKDAVKPQGSEPLFQKNVNSAFIGTNLEQQLRSQGYDTLVIVGLTTQHCVSTTTRMAGNLGFHTYLVSDATAAYDLIGPDGRHYPAADIHAISLAALHGEFATVVTTDTLLQSHTPTP